MIIIFSFRFVAAGGSRRVSVGEELIIKPRGMRETSVALAGSWEAAQAVLTAVSLG